MITKERVNKYFQSDFISDLDGYFIVSNWQRSEETPFGVSDDTHFINLYQRNSNSTVTSVCYSWKTTERDLIFSAIFAYLYVAQKSIYKIAGRDAMLAFCKKFSFPALRDFSPNGYFDVVTALKEANLAPTKNESASYFEMLDTVIPTLRELVHPFIQQYDCGEEIASLIESNVANFYKWVANTKDELISFYGVLMRKEYFESGYYDAKYFPLDCLVNTLQDNGLYSWQELAKKPIQKDSPLPNYDRLDNPIVAHYGDIEFIINYNNQEKEEEWYLKEDTPEEEKQLDLYNILINTLWADEKYCENGKYGIKDCRGRVILPAEYDNCLGGLSSAAYISPEEMIIAVKQNSKWGFVKRNSALEQVVSFKYDSIEDTLNGVYITNIGELYGIIGKRGIEILPTIMEDIYQPSFEGHIIYKQDGKYGFRLKNKSRSTELFDEVNLDSEEYLSVCCNGEWGYIGENAQFTTDAEKAIRNIGFEFHTMIESKMQEIAHINLRETKEGIFPDGEYDVQVYSDDAELPHLHIVKDDWDIAFLIDSGELHKIYKQGSSNDVYDYAVNNIKQWLDSRCCLLSKISNKENATLMWVQSHREEENE